VPTVLRILFAAGIAVLASVAVAPSAAVAEAPTPQAIDANAEFLAYAPPPPVPAKVCVVDTGVDLTTDAAPAVIERHSVFGGTTDDVGGSGMAKHGTFVAGVIASQADGRDSVGIWPQARIVSVRMFRGPGGGTTTAAMLAALERCRQLDATVVNLSLSGLDQATGAELEELGDRLTVLRSRWGINVVAGAGNNAGEVGYPARFALVLAVGANDARGILCGFSNRGTNLDVSALGCAAEVSWPGGGTGYGEGTSYSAPTISGVLAAMRAYRPALTAEAAEQLLVSTAAAGRVDASAAFTAAGLGGLVNADVPAEPTSPAPVGDRLAAFAPVVAGDPLAKLGVHEPLVRIASLNRGVLTIRVTGVPDFGRAVFRVDSRRYERRVGFLRIRQRRLPRRVTVRIDIPNVGRTREVSVRVRNGTTSKSKRSTRMLK
jgi:hypothetical protein